MPGEKIGCCGANCGTCKCLEQNTCLGCKVGYISGTRDITKAKCKIKICCMNKQYITCGDCAEYEICSIINDFYNKNGYKYMKYKQATEYIRKYGYDTFISVANTWKNAYGRY